ncbi:MAG: M1 family metallopeptidase [Sphingomicrobium sp.]
MTRTQSRRFLAASALSALALGACTSPLATAPALTPPPPAPAVTLSQPIDQSIPTQLPRTAIPLHYALTVTPDAARLTFAGNVRIDVDVVEPTDKLVLNANQLALSSATLTGVGGLARTAAVSLDAAAQTATLAFGERLQPGRYALDIAYTGKINTQANGLFALDYKDAKGAERRSLFTQFEAPDARRFVPSWDEPIYKATWDLSAIVPADDMAVSNMPAAHSEPTADGRKRVTFQTSPRMSSYLLFFGSGDFGRIAKMAGNTEVGIVATRGNEEKSRYALDAEAEILTHYNDYFGTPYPLPKLDNVAGPGQSQFFGAMENWGAIFTFEYILLNDPAITSEAQRQSIFSVEAHEMAHQWFGDLVTMAWWDDLWLNEGFASWMENRTTQQFHPDWGAEFERLGGREGAMGFDAFSTTHPIVQQIRTVEQTNQAFDAITYSKGESVIAMLEGYTGPDVWRQGIRNYLAEHKYGNSRTDDLWRAVEAAGGTGLTQIAHDFTLQPGIPLIGVGASQCVGGATRVTLTQSEFGADRKPGSFTPLRWHVPVTAQTIGGAVVRAVTQGPSTDIIVPGCGPLMINAGQTGYYRTLYRPEQVAALKASFARLGGVDQYGLVADNRELSFAGYQPMGRALDLINVVPTDGSPKLVEAALGSWRQLYGRFDGDKATQARINRIIVARFAPVLARIGFVPRAGEPVMVTTLRPRLIGTLGRAGDPQVKREAARLFAALATDPKAIPGSLKTTWLSVIGNTADAATWDRLHAMAKAATSATERSALYTTLAATDDPVLLKRTLDLAVGNEPGATISASMIGAVAGSNPELGLDFALAHLPRIGELVDSSASSGFIARLGGGSSDPATIAKLNAYADAHVAAADRKPFERVIAAIRTRLAANPRIRAETLAWLNANRL